MTLKTAGIRGLFYSCLVLEWSQYGKNSTPTIFKQQKKLKEKPQISREIFQWKEKIKVLTSEKSWTCSTDAHWLTETKSRRQIDLTVSSILLDLPASECQTDGAKAPVLERSTWLFNSEVCCWCLRGTIFYYTNFQLCRNYFSMVFDTNKKLQIKKKIVRQPGAKFN